MHARTRQQQPAAGKQGRRTAQINTPLGCTTPSPRFGLQRVAVARTPVRMSPPVKLAVAVLLVLKQSGSSSVCGARCKHERAAAGGARRAASQPAAHTYLRLLPQPEEGCPRQSLCQSSSSVIIECPFVALACPMD